MENVRFSISVSSYDISRQLPAQFKVQVTDTWWEYATNIYSINTNC